MRPKAATHKRVELAKAKIRQFPKHGARTIARALHSEEPQLFPSLESARSCVRGLTGQNGKRTRDGTRKAPLRRPARKPGYRLDLPKSRANNRLPVKLTGERRMLVISDLHIPYHDPDAVSIALNKGLADGVDTVLLLGDIMDCYPISRWTRDPGMPSIKEELEATRKFLDVLRTAFPEADIIWKEGNHEERWKHFLFNNAPQLAELESASLYHNVGAKGLSIRVVDDKRRIDAGKLSLYHGHELPKGLTNPVNQARGQFLRAISSMMCGHGHRTSTHVEASERGPLFANWSLGCLCHLRPDFAVVNKWNHGFARIDLEKCGKYHVQNFIIHEGELLGASNDN